jgi:hypothetical protein
MKLFTNTFNFYKPSKNIKLQSFTANNFFILITILINFFFVASANSIERNIDTTEVNTVNTVNTVNIHDEDSNKYADQHINQNGNQDLNEKAKVSFSFEQTQFSPEAKLNEAVLKVIQNNAAAGNSDQNADKALAIKRSEMIFHKQRYAKKTIKNNKNKKFTQALNDINASSELTDDYYYIYDAYIQLIEDLDNDGFYQTFSITFDADINSYSPFQQAQLYAELYIRTYDGAWEHYFTTDNFIITGDSAEDSYQVYSTLSYGFQPEYYDVLIDLYEVGNPYIVASYSNENNSNLSTLPLESSEYEQLTVYAASTSVVLFSFLLISLLTKVIVIRKTHEC